MKKKSATVRVEQQPQYKKIGRLRKSIADQIHRITADICVSEGQLKHVFNRHGVDSLKEVGLTSEEFVCLIVNNFNRIYEGSNDALLLVKWNGMPKVVVITLVFSKRFYRVKTAHLTGKNSLNKKVLLWKK
jgi:hypothetical protein